MRPYLVIRERVLASVAVRLAGVIVPAAVVGLALAAATPTVSARTPPNIVFVMTDDLDLGLVTAQPPVMPSLAATIARAGATFTNAFVNVPLCAPSRATMLTGRYAHNTRVLRNGSNTGSFTEFHKNGSEASTIAVWLRNAGYETALFGKYLNRYPNTVTRSFVPPGWSDWAVPVGGDLNGPYVLNENGTLVSRDGTSERDYFTDVLREKSLAFIDRAAAAGKPFFLMVTPTAPHAPATPAPRHRNLFTDRVAPRPPSFNESDVSDKPPFLRLRKLSAAAVATLDEVYRNRLRSLRAVDEAIQAIVDKLRALGALERTYLVFTSDNGYHLGHHRMTASTGGGKETMYDEDLRIPLFIRGPGVPAALTVGGLANVADLAPTFAAWAGVTPASVVDGRSLQPLLQAEPPASWRQSTPIAHWAPLRQPITDASQDFVGVRTARYAFVRYPSFGLRDAYSVKDDPHQLKNIGMTGNAWALRNLDTLTTRLSSCSGDTCRALEDAAAP